MEEIVYVPAPLSELLKEKDEVIKTLTEKMQDKEEQIERLLKITEEFIQKHKANAALD